MRFETEAIWWAWFGKGLSQTGVTRQRLAREATLQNNRDDFGEEWEEEEKEERGGEA